MRVCNVPVSRKIHVNPLTTYWRNTVSRGAQTVKNSYKSRKIKIVLVLEESGPLDVHLEKLSETSHFCVGLVTLCKQYVTN